MIEILNENSALRVINKPANISLLRDRQGGVDLWSRLNDELGKCYMVHRLDKGTSGVLLVARSQGAQRRLTQAFANHEVRKFYLAWVVGRLPEGQTLRVNLPLCKGRKSRYRVAAPRESIKFQDAEISAIADREHVSAVTKARCLLTTETHSLVLLKPKHGRTHQLRVHLSWIGHPIVGDHLYGRPKEPAQLHHRLLLHCHAITVLGQRYQAPVPADFTMSV